MGTEKKALWVPHTVREELEREKAKPAPVPPPEAKKDPVPVVPQKTEQSPVQHPALQPPKVSKPFFTEGEMTFLRRGTMAVAIPFVALLVFYGLGQLKDALWPPKQQPAAVSEYHPRHYYQPRHEEEQEPMVQHQKMVFVQNTAVEGCYIRLFQWVDGKPVMFGGYTNAVNPKHIEPVSYEGHHFVVLQAFEYDDAGRCLFSTDPTTFQDGTWTWAFSPGSVSRERGAPSDAPSL